jgi:hypothetical protein
MAGLRRDIICDIPSTTPHPAVSLLQFTSLWLRREPVLDEPNVPQIGAIRGLRSKWGCAQNTPAGLSG